MNETFCGFQFKKWFFFALLMIFAENLSDTVNYILIPIIFGVFFGINGFFIGMMLVSIASCVIFAIFLRIRYKKRFPLLLEVADIASQDAKLNFDRVLELNDWAEGKILKRGIDSKLAMRISLIIEEIVMSFDDAKLQSAYIYADKIKKITG